MVVRCVATLALGLAAAGCGGADERSESPSARASGAVERVEREVGTRPPTDAERLAGLLARRAAALQAGDARGYAATAVGFQRVRDRVVARRAARLPVRRVELLVRRSRVRGDVARLRVVLVYRFRGVAARFAGERTVRARRTRSGWRVTAVAGRRARAPWEVAAFRTVRAPHVLLLAPPGLDVAPLAQDLAAAYRGMAARLPGRRLPQRVLAVAAAGTGPARRLTARIRGVRTLAAIADTAVEEEGPARAVARVVSQRLLVVVPAWAAMGFELRMRVLMHELTHLALAGATSGRVPSWLVEGLAMEASDDDRSAEAALRAATGRAVPLTELCGPAAIGRLNGDRQAAAYATASAAAHRLAADHGRRGLLRLYAAFGDERIRGRPGCRLTDGVLRRTLGTSLRRLDAALASP
jgi:hypothetical protein